MTPVPERLPCALAPLSLGRPEDPADLVGAAVAGGFSGVGLTARSPEGRWRPWACDAAAIGRLRELLHGHDLRVPDVGVLTVDHGTEPAEVAALARYAAAVGAPRLVAMCRDPDPVSAARTLTTTAAIAAAHGVRVALEPMPYTAVRDVHDALALLDRVGSPDVGILLDLFQHVRAGRGPEDLRADVVERTVLVQLSDGVAQAPAPERLREEALTDRRYPGEGDFALADLLRPLPTALPVTVETPCRRHAALPLADQARLLAAATRRLMVALGRW